MSNHTIYDVARIAGVSGKTVSRVINNERGVSLETRAKVEKIIDEVGFQPHSGARSMRAQRRDCVGVVFPATVEAVPFSDQQIQWLFLELYRIFGMRGHFICFDLDASRGEETTDYGRALWQQRCSGCVVHGPLPVNDPVIQRIHHSGHPYMTFNRQDNLPELSYAAVDYEEAAYLSARYLIQRGHRRIGMLQAFVGYQPGVERWRGYTRALEEAGLPFDESLVRPVSFQAHDIAKTTHRLLQDTSMTALIDCSALESATSLREGATLAGRAPGQDFELVAWTYSAGRIVFPEACAHVWTPLREAAEEGLERLVKWFDREQEEPFQVLYRPTLFEQPPTQDLVLATPIFETLPG